MSLQTASVYVMPRKTDELRAQLEKWIRLLGWRSRLRKYQHVVDDDASPRLRGKVITWYTAGKSTGGRDDCFLQINEAPQGHSAWHEASIYAIRYRIFTGWHRFRLCWTEAKLREEAERLDEWLHWRWFAGLEGRRTFRQAHPKCVGYTWTKIAKEAPPK
jgi:hypothetical protein